MAPILEESCKANFDDIVSLHDTERSITLRKVHPKAIEKTSVKLATAVYHDSIRSML